MITGSRAGQAGLHDSCVGHAVLGHPERICVGCYQVAEDATGITSAFALAAWIAERGWA